MIGSTTTAKAAGNRRARRAAAARARQRGLSLIETAAALGIVALMLVSFGKLTAENQVASRSRATAIQMQQLTTAAAQYIQTKYTEIANNFPDGSTAGSPTLFVPFSSDEGNGTNNLPSIEATGLLGKAFSNKNPYGQKATLAITSFPGDIDPVTGIRAPPRIEGMIYTSGGQAIPDSELGRIATSIGASGGFVPKAALPGGGVPGEDILGAFGGWKSKTAVWNTTSGGMPSAGHIASTLAFQSGVGDSNYLSRYDTSPYPNDMHTDIAFNRDDKNGLHSLTGAALVSADNLQATQTVSGQTLSASGQVNSPIVANASGDMSKMYFDMNSGTANNIMTISGVVQPIVGVGATTTPSVNFTDAIQVQGAIQANGGLNSAADITSNQNIMVNANNDSGANNGGVWAPHFFDYNATKYNVTPSQMSNFASLSAQYMNADTVLWGSSINRVPLDPVTGAPMKNPLDVYSCQPADAPCLKNLAAALAAYNLAVQQASVPKVNGEPAPMRLGDLLPTMVQKGVFVVDSAGNVTDGQPTAAHLAGAPVTWWFSPTPEDPRTFVPVASPSVPVTDSQGVTHSNTGAVMKPACVNGTPQLYISKLDDSYSFNLKFNENGDKVIDIKYVNPGTVDKATNTVSGEVIMKGLTSGSPAAYDVLATLQSGKIVQDLDIGTGVSLSSTVTVGSTADSVDPVTGRPTAASFWGVYVDDSSEYKSGVNGAKRSVPRRVLAQTFCNYNNQQRSYATTD